MARTFYSQVLRNFDWKLVLTQAEENYKEEINCWKESPWHILEGDIVGRSFLGTVMTLMPSGKYYTSWASNNVAPCPRCKGTGLRGPLFEEYCTLCEGLGSVEVSWDVRFRNALDKAAEKYGGWIANGDDPCDLFFCWVPDSEEEPCQTK